MPSGNRASTTVESYYCAQNTTGQSRMASRITMCLATIGRRRPLHRQLVFLLLVVGLFSRVKSLPTVSSSEESLVPQTTSSSDASTTSHLQALKITHLRRKKSFQGAVNAEATDPSASNIEGDATRLQTLRGHHISSHRNLMTNSIPANGAANEDDGQTTGLHFFGLATSSDDENERKTFWRRNNGKKARKKSNRSDKRKKGWQLELPWHGNGRGSAVVVSSPSSPLPSPASESHNQPTEDHISMPQTSSPLQPKKRSGLTSRAAARRERKAGTKREKPISNFDVAEHSMTPSRPFRQQPSNINIKAPLSPLLQDNISPDNDDALLPGMSSLVVTNSNHGTLLPDENDDENLFSFFSWPQMSGSKHPHEIELTIYHRH